MKKGKIILLTIIGICLIISLVLGISYSLWSLRVTQTDSNSVVADCFNITFTESNNILLQNTYPIHDEDGMQLEPYTFTVKNNCSSYADYEVQLEILNTSTLDEQYLKIMVDDNEPVLMNTLEVSEPKESNTKIAYTLDKGFIDKNEEKTYNLRVWLADFVTTETDGVQNSKWSAKVTLKASYRNNEPTYCELNPDIATCKILAKGETNELKYDNTTDNNLRYVGADPNNYVSFNNELWRIIGVMNNIDDGTGKKETRLKLIRNESIGKYSWDNKAAGIGSSASANGSSDWTDSTLQIMLNEGAYWNRTAGDCPYGKNGATTPCDFMNIGLTNEAKEMLDNTKWNLGGISTNSTTITSNFYDIERGVNVYNGRNNYWIGQIGLMYPSDYGYATSGGTSITRETCLSKELYNWDDSLYNECKNNNWLYKNSVTEWLLTSEIATSYNVYTIGSAGRVRSSGAYNTFNLIYPTLYLKSNIRIISGDGSTSNPYQLSL